VAAEAAPQEIRFLAGGGEMGAHMRALDWTTTPVGPPEDWPQALKTTVRLILTSRHPMFIWWGEALTCFYNDAYSTLIGPDRHPSALGRAGREVWAEIWDVIGPQIEFVMAGRGATWHQQQLIPITRGDAREDVWWTYGYSPIDDDASPSGVGGVLVVCRDVTAEVRARQAHADEAERLRQLFEQAPGFMALLRGPGHIFELANAAYLSLVGRDVRGKPVRDALPELEGQGFFGWLDQAYATGEPVVARRAPVTLASGPEGTLERRVVDFIYQPIQDAGGAVTGIFVEGSDVTHAQLAEDALRATQERQALLLRLVRGQRETGDPEAMMLAASEALGRHLGANRVGFFEMLDDDTMGFTTGWMDGGLDLLSGTFPAAGIGTGYLAEVRAGRVLAIADFTQDPRAADSRFSEIGTRSGIGVPIIRDGRWHAGMYVNHATVRRWTEEEAALVRDVAEQTWDAVERARAVQALREGEARLRMAQEATGIGTWEWDPETGGVLWTPVQYALFGLDPARDGPMTYERFVAETVDHRDRAKVETALHEAAATGGTYECMFRACRRVPGGRQEMRWIIARGCRVRRADGSPGRMLGVARDVTDRQVAEARLQDLQAELLHVSRLSAAGEMASALAHELNQPLTAATSAIQAVRRMLASASPGPLKGPAAEMREAVDLAAEQALWAGRIVRRLRDFVARGETEKRLEELPRLVEEASALALAGAKERLVHVAFRLEPAASAVVDAIQIQQVLFNLIRNAVEAMTAEGDRGDGAPTRCRDLVVSTAPAGPGMVEVAVSDSGPGLAPEVAGRLFEPFVSTKPNGMGVGLSICRSIVEAHGGRLWAEPSTGGGTVFRFTLPAMPSEAGACLEAGEAAR
jgi:signal transduction histidine kinase